MKCESKEAMISENWIVANSGQKIPDEYRIYYRFIADNDFDNFSLEFNDYSNAWIYRDFRNCIYDIKTQKELKTILELVKNKFPINFD